MVELVVDSVVTVEVPLITVAVELVVDSVVTADVPLINMVDVCLNGHCEKEFENDKNGK